jgi:DNA polymerase III alpha subunit (gram-positive type)
MTLGDFELRKELEEEIDPIEWAYTSAQAHNLALQEMAQLKARVEGEQGTIDKLNAQLQDFIKTKNESETAMLQQFVELLNEKKRNIRDQSRILAGAKVDKTTGKYPVAWKEQLNLMCLEIASTVQTTREETNRRKPVASRASKRKAPVKEETKEESDSDQIEVDQSKEEERNEESGPEAATPDRSTDGETEDEEDAINERGPVLTSRSKGTSDPVPPRTASVPRAPPPKRELPFSRPSTRNKPSERKPPPPEADEDEETDDEEL